jgi:hypothetical protein
MMRFPKNRLDRELEGLDHLQATGAGHEMAIWFTLLHRSGVITSQAVPRDRIDQHVHRQAVIDQQDLIPEEAHRRTVLVFVQYVHAISVDHSTAITHGHDADRRARVRPVGTEPLP